MADPKIRIRRSATPNKVPSTTQLLLGELAINTYDGKVYLEQDQGGVGVGTTVVAINPWGVGIGSTAFSTQFTSGKVGIATTNPQYSLDVGGDINFSGNLFQDGSEFTSGVGIRTAGGTVGWAATIIDFRGPGVTTAYYSSSTGIGTVYFQGGGGGGNASVTVADAAPSSPSNGDLWFKSDVGELYLWYTDGSSNQWVEASGGSNTVITNDTAPSSPQDGDLWWNSNSGELKVYYNDGNSSQWVDASSGGGIGQYWGQTNTNGTTGVTTTAFVGIGTTAATDVLTVRGNANVTGFLTATQLNGVVSSTGVNVTGVVTALNLISPVTSSGVNVTGVATALQLKGPLTSSGINVTGVSTFSNTVDINSNLDVSGNVTVGGVLTYEDVKNVDSIGIVTARTGLKVLAGGANIVDGTTTDELNVTGVATAVQLNATTTNVSGVSTFAGNIDANGDLDVDGITNLDDVNIAGVSTFAGNIDANGDLDVDGHTELDNVNVIGIATIQQVKATTLNVTGVSTVTGGVKVGTAATICSEGNMTINRPSAGIITATKFIGDGSDLTGVISGIGIGTAGGVVGYAATIVHFKGAGVTTAYYNASTGIGTVFFHSAGGGGSANVTIADAPPSSPSAGDLWWESDIGELKIYYNDGNSSQWVDASGADSLVQIGTSAPTGAVSGDLWWNSESGDLLVYYTDTNTSQWISVNAVNSQGHWHSNNTGISTTLNVGIGTTTVTDALTVVGATDLDGTLLVSGITTFGTHVYHGDGDKAIFGDGSDLEIYHSGTKSIINDAGTGNLELQVGGSTKFATTSSGIEVTGDIVGSGSTAYSTGLIVGKQGAEFQGVVTATTFVGALTGNASTATLATNAQGLTGTPAITVGALTANTGQFSGNVNVLGTLTYEDVKNVDSAGIATARQGLRITGGGLDVVGVSTFAADVSIADKIIHTGDTNTALRFPSADVFTTETGGSERLRCDADGVKTLNGRFYSAGTFAYIESSSTSNSTLTLRKTASGADAIDYLQLRDNSNALKLKVGGDGIIYTPDVLASHEGDTDTKIRFPAADTITAEVGGSEITRVTSSGLGINVTPNRELHVKGLDAIVRVESTSATGRNVIEFFDSSAAKGSIGWPASGNDHMAIQQSENADMWFSTNDTERLRITSAGHLQLQGGTVYGDDSATATFKLQSTSGNSNHARIEIGAIQSSDNGGIHFYTAGSSAATRYMTLKGGGNLGIGEDNPSHKLNIKNAAACIVQVESTDNNTSSVIQLLGKNSSGTVRTAKLAYDNADQVRLITPDAIPLCFLTQNSERLRIDSSGRLLLGLTSSIGGHAIFQVQGSGNRKAHFHQPDTGSCIVQFTNTTTGTSTSDGAIIGLDGDESLLISQKENNHIAIHTNNTERLRIDSSGRVGINNNNPDRTLDLISTQGGNCDIELKTTNNTGWCQLIFSDTDAVYRGGIGYSHTNDFMSLYTVNTEQVRITSGGQVLINTTTPAAFASRLLTISDVTSGGTTAMEIRSATNGTGRVYFTDSTNSSNAGSYAGKVLYDHNTDHMAFWTNGNAERLRIGPDGQIGIAGANYGSSGQALLSGGSGASASWGTPAAPSLSDSDNYSGSHICMGTNAGKYTSANYKICIGYNAGRYGSARHNSVFIGVSAGEGASSGTVNGQHNVCIGNYAGQDLTTGSSNTLIGPNAGKDVNTGNSNVIIGNGAASTANNCDGTVVIGHSSGYGFDETDYSVIIGHGASGEALQGNAADNQLYIARQGYGGGHSGTWIYGNSSGQCQQGGGSSSWYTGSDERYKNFLGKYSRGLAEINGLNVQNFKWKDKEDMPSIAFNYAGSYCGPEIDGKTRIGVGAQSCEALIPEAVNKLEPAELDKGGNHMLTLDNDPIFWAMVNAIQELSAKNDALTARVTALES